MSLLVLAHLGSSGQRAVKWLCVCVCVCACVCGLTTVDRQRHAANLVQNSQDSSAKCGLNLCEMQRQFNLQLYQHNMLV